MKLTLITCNSRVNDDSRGITQEKNTMYIVRRKVYYNRRSGVE